MEKAIRLLRLGRPHFVVAGFLLYTCGALLAVLSGAVWDPGRFALGYAVLFGAHLSVSYSNDYFDAEGDRFSQPSLFAGGSGILQAYPALRSTAKRIAQGLIAASLVLGVLFAVIHRQGLGFFALVVAGNLLGWYYSAPPVRLSCRGLGEISTATTVGLLVPAMGYLVMHDRLDSRFWLFAGPLLLYGLTFILVVQIPDLEADLMAKKRTLVSRIGRRTAFLLVAALQTLATGAFFVLGQFLARGYPVNLILVGLYSLVPMLTGAVAGIHRPLERRRATYLANALLAALVVFVTLTDAHMLSQINQNT